jgi:hypothetical protein
MHLEILDLDGSVHSHASAAMPARWPLARVRDHHALVATFAALARTIPVNRQWSAIEQAARAC